MQQSIPDVGAPDPERRTSPILDEDEEETLDSELETGVCFFNDIAYAIGDYVRSGDEVLLCADRGIWVRKAELAP